MLRGCSIAWMLLTMSLALAGGDHVSAECDALTTRASMERAFTLSFPLADGDRPTVVRHAFSFFLLRLGEGGNTRQRDSAPRAAHDIPACGEFGDVPGFQG